MIAIGIDILDYIAILLIFFLFTLQNRDGSKKRVLLIRVQTHVCRFAVLARAYCFISQVWSAARYTQLLRDSIDDGSSTLSFASRSDEPSGLRGMNVSDDRKVKHIRNLESDNNYGYTPDEVYDSLFKKRILYQVAFCPFGSLVKPFIGYSWDGKYYIFPLAPPDNYLIPISTTFTALLTVVHIICFVGWSSYAAVLFRGGTGLEKRNWLTFADPSAGSDMLTYLSSSQLLQASLERDSLVVDIQNDLTKESRFSTQTDVTCQENRLFDSQSSTLRHVDLILPDIGSSESSNSTATSLCGSMPKELEKKDISEFKNTSSELSSASDCNAVDEPIAPETNCTSLPATVSSNDPFDIFELRYHIQQDSLSLDGFHITSQWRRP
eukprot:GHVH01000649.1.p1 GENE.GHVH01000649.1~~GHVH01000649.1.p1  ORF type:complete len:381 (+),score=40.02 GHVH01000649.1:203-1345(+)